MSGSGNWSARISRSGNAERIRLFERNQQLSLQDYFGRLQDDPEFAAWYAELLAESQFSNYFWEHPPMTTRNFASTAEFVLIDAPSLANSIADSAAFSDHFEGSDIAVFRNLGRDAILIAPPPDPSGLSYAHLAMFLRTAPERQIMAFWQCVGRTVCQSLSDDPLWLSTSGLGVAWLHVRLDRTPKYYQHAPYKAPVNVSISQGE